MKNDKRFYYGANGYGKDIPVELDVDDVTTALIYQHIYKSNFEGTWERHACFQWGHWCWKQAREHPIEAIKYLMGCYDKN